jgi:hypothetical protein
MAQGYIVPLPQRLFDTNGLPAVSWTIETFTATGGTFSTPLVTYSDATLLSSNGVSATTDPSGYYRMFLAADTSLDLRVKNAAGVVQYTFLNIRPETSGYTTSDSYNRTGATDTGGTYASATFTSPTLSSITNSDVKVLAADATANSGSTGATLTSLTGFSWTLVAAGTYAFTIRGKVGMTTNGGLSLAFKYTTLTLTSIVVNAFQRTASVFALAQSTTTTDQTKFIDQKAVVYINVELQGSLIVNAGGTLAVQFAQNTSHADTTTVFKGFTGEFVRTS